jgi:F-type H+-transporting ATPase subunit c
MNWLALVSIISAAVAVSFGAIGPALAEGRAVAAAINAIARQPEFANTISRMLFVGLAMITPATSPQSPEHRPNAAPALPPSRAASRGRRQVLWYP